MTPIDASAYIIVKDYNMTYRFTGITAVEHSYTLRLYETVDITEAASLVNGAKKQPEKVTLSVVESDTNRIPGWSARMLDILESIHARRLLCRVVTTYKTYDNMLLSSVSVTQDETNMAGWAGDLTFSEYIPVKITSTSKTADNSSTPTNTGSAAPAQTVSGSPLQQMLRAAGINI